MSLVLLNYMGRNIKVRKVGGQSLGNWCHKVISLLE